MTIAIIIIIVAVGISWLWGQAVPPEERARLPLGNTQNNIVYPHYEIKIYEERLVIDAPGSAQITMSIAAVGFPEGHQVIAEPSFRFSEGQSGSWTFDKNSIKVTDKKQEVRGTLTIEEEDSRGIAHWVGFEVDGVQRLDMVRVLIIRP